MNATTPAVYTEAASTTPIEIGTVAATTPVPTTAAASPSDTAPAFTGAAARHAVGGLLGLVVVAALAL